VQTVLRFVGLPAAGLTSPSEAVRTPLPWRQLNGSEPFAKLIPCATLRRLALFFNRPNAELYRVMNDTEHGRGTADPLEPPFPPFDEASFFSKNIVPQMFQWEVASATQQGRRCRQARSQAPQRRTYTCPSRRHAPKPHPEHTPISAIALCRTWGAKCWS